MAENVTDKCDLCGCITIVRDNHVGELVCNSCGYVIKDEEMNLGPEWRAFSFEDSKKRSRADGPVTLRTHDKGLSTSIGTENRDYSGKTIKSVTKYKFYRLRKWDRRTKFMESKHRNLSEALSCMNIIGGKLNLPKSVLETSAKIYRRALKENLIRGRSINQMAAASLYMASRECKVIRSLEEVSQKAGLSVNKLAKCYRELFWKLEKAVPQTDQKIFISKIVNSLNLLGMTERIAITIFEGAEKERLTSGKSPGGISAACIYISSQLTDDSRTQKDIAMIADITEVTLRNRYKDLLKQLSIQIKL
jgi:transcription initiation factor TFIIB